MDVVARVHNDLALIAEVILHERRGATTTHAFDLVSGGKPLSAKTVEHALYRSLPGMRASLEEPDNDELLQELASLYGSASGRDTAESE